jgi:hypothetical protein
MTLYDINELIAMKEPKSPGNNTIIQFRVDDLFFTQMSAVANRLATPVGVLARQWVAERLSNEITADFKTVSNWQTTRYAQLSSKIPEELPSGPIQLIHFVPFNFEGRIDFEAAKKLSTVFVPFEGSSMYAGRRNRLGYVWTDVIQNEKTRGYVQLFSNGAVESVRVLKTINEEVILGEHLDLDLIRAVWMYANGLNSLGIQLPILLRITFKNMHGCCLRLSNDALSWRSTEIDENEFALSDLHISDWQDVLRLEEAAQFLKPLLDEIWNAGGFERSPSYKNNGQFRAELIQ